MSEYIERFLSLKCSGDVLNAVGSMHKPEKEITESMGIIKHLKSITLKEKMKYNVVDLCADNALTSILACHMLPIKNAIAIDKKKRSGHYDKVKRFKYLEQDINKCWFDMSIVDSYEIQKFIAIAVHPCKTADDITRIFNENPIIEHLIMMPCCNGDFKDLKNSFFLKGKGLSRYDLWTLHLANNIKNSEVSIHTDLKILSPKNNIIVAHKKIK
jgi:hypothetical protein